MAGAWDWPGARWWKCDLHVHTPGSDDHKDDPAPTPDAWVQAAKDAGLHVVAVTDHNTGAWIDRVPRGPELAVVPGVELTCASGVHLLVLFDPALAPAEARDRVAGFIGACDVPPPAPKMKHTVRSPKSMREAMAVASKHGGVCVAAHADALPGGFMEMEQGEEIRLIVKDSGLHGIELRKFDPAKLKYVDGSMKPYRRAGGLLPLLSSSDAHRIAEIGTRWTWIKMTRPTLPGLRLALQDGPLSVRNDQAGNGDPNAVPDLAVESVEIANTAHLGNGQPFELRLNPWLNALIGGRGTGKSTVVELLRVTLQRAHEVPKSLRDEWDQLVRQPDQAGRRGVLKPDTSVSVIYRRDGGRFRITWKGARPSEIAEDQAGQWVARPGDVASRFPIRVYSQKQVYELTREPEALLRIIDESHEVNAAEWAEKWKAEEARFLSLRAQAREIEGTLAEEPKVTGALDDIKRRLAVFETAGHADVLKRWQARRRQERVVEEWEAGIDAAVGKMATLAEEAEPGPLDAEPFDTADADDAALLAEAQKALGEMLALRDEALALVARAEALKAAWATTRAASAWSVQVKAAVAAYDQLIAALKAAGGGDPSEYGRLVQQRGALEARKAAFAGQRQTQLNLVAQADASLAKLRGLRDELTQRRSNFLATTLAGNEYVRIDVVPCGAADAVMPELRRVLGREDRTFEKDIGTVNERGTLVGDLVSAYPDAFERADPAKRGPLTDALHARLAALKTKLREIAKTGDGAQDRRFGQHMQARTPEALDRLDAWFPPDSLLVAYRTGAAGEKYQPITQGSPGQRSAAMLAFLLSYGREPIVLDQPEDDLDNHLIYDLIVKQLRLIKHRRQVLVVTHNPNIVVNGDAEYVVALKAGKGQAFAERQGGLQEQEVRDTICQVMEGGKDAFRDRYRRIALGENDV